MADEQQEVRRVNWNEVLTVTHVFKSFRMAIHFSKLALALAAVVLVWVWGWALDRVSSSAGVYVPNGEIAQHAAASPAEFAAWKDKLAEERPTDVVRLWQRAMQEEKDLRAYLDHRQAEFQKQNGKLRAASSYFADAFSALLQDSNFAPKGDKTPAETFEKKAKEDWRAALGDVKAIQDREIERIEAMIDRCSGKNGAAAKKIDADKSLDGNKRKPAHEKREADEAAALRALTLRKIEANRARADVQGSKVFEALLAYEGRCLDNAVVSVRSGNFAGGMKAYRTRMEQRARMLQLPPVVGAPGAQDLAAASAAPADDPAGLLYWLLMALHGLGWLVCQHWLYAAAFLIVAMGIWALFGGAVHRIAALHFARDEKISMGQALRFSYGKFLSFFTAPLIPLLIVLVIGLFQIAGGFLLGSWGGGIVMGVLFLLAIIGGLLIAFLLTGLIGGGALMYPTIAVEGSDSFDAISRSYSYVFEKPWRAAFYGLAALVYGVVCYLFVRLFAFVALCTTHGFVGAGVVGGGQTISPAADKLDVLWPAPTFNNLLTPLCWEAMSGWEKVGAGLLHVWVFLVAAAVVAFGVSYASSAVTVIYYLLRRKVDATDLDDVYVEEPEEEAIEAQPPAAGGEPPKPAEEAKEDKPAEPKPAKDKPAGEGEGKGEA